MPDQLISRVLLIPLVLGVSHFTSKGLCSFSCKIIFPHLQIKSLKLKNWKQGQKAQVLPFCKKEVKLATTMVNFMFVLGNKQHNSVCHPITQKSTIWTGFLTCLLSLWPVRWLYAIQECLHARIFKILLIYLVTVCNLTENRTIISKILYYIGSGRDFFFLHFVSFILFKKFASKCHQLFWLLVEDWSSEHLPGLEHCFISSHCHPCPLCPPCKD